MSALSVKSQKDPQKRPTMEKRYTKESYIHTGTAPGTLGHTGSSSSRIAMKCKSKRDPDTKEPKRPTKETNKRDQQKRPEKET